MDKPTQLPPNMSFQEPPNVTVIEASCKQAHQKSEDFSSFTTVLKNPIIINKGDEIRAVASYIDCPGIDSEIIQFTRSGTEQDNTHTMVSQMYTVNDGFQQKTTSYDYMTRKTGLQCIFPGGKASSPAIVLPSALPAHHKLELRTFNPDGSALGLGAFITGYPVGKKALVKIDVVAGGKNFSDGDEITFTGSTATAKIFVDGVGAIKSVLVTNPGSAVVLTNKKFITANTDAGGENLTYTITTGVGGVEDHIMDVTGFYPLFPQRTDYPPNGKYLPGDLAHIYITPDQHSGGADPATGTDTGCRAYINSVYQGNPSQNGTSDTPPLSLAGYFDQGYNYQRTALQRWCQTYENTNLFCYGRNFERRYKANDGIEYALPDVSSINQKDSCLSASILCRRKEDEFVSGFFHNEYSDNTSYFKNKRCAIEITSSNCNFVIGREDQLHLASQGNPGFNLNTGTGRLLIAPIKKTEYFNSNEPFIEENQIDFEAFATSFLVPGMVVSLKFELVTPNINKELELHNQFQSKWGGIYPIGTQTIVQSTAQTPLMQHYIGPKAMFDSNVSTGSYTKASMTNGSVKSVNFCKGLDSSIDAGLGNSQSGVTAIFKWVKYPLAARTEGGKFLPAGAETFVQEYIVLEFNTNNTGGLTDVYFQSAALPATKFWRVGDVVRPVIAGEADPGAGVYPKMSANVAALRIMITATDSAGGADFGSFDQLTNSNMKLAVTNEPVKLIITPMPYYMSGLQTFFKTGPNEVNPNGFGVKRTATAMLRHNGDDLPVSSGGQSFNNYSINFPPTFSNCFKLNYTPTSAPDGGDDGNISSNAHCVLHKPSGISKNEEIGTKNNVYSYHDKTQTLELPTGDMNVNIKTASFSIGPNTGAGAGAHSIIRADSTIAGGTFPLRTLSFNLEKIIADHSGIVASFRDLPLHGLVILNEGLVTERHLQMDGFVTKLGEVYTMGINSACVPQSVSYNFTVPDGMSDVDADKRFQGSIGTANGFTDIIGIVSIKWITEPWTVNNDFLARFTNKQGGSLAYTSFQNFFGNKDLNLNSDSLLKSSNWRYITSPAYNRDNNINSYDKGGVYLLTQNTGGVENSEVQAPYRDFFGFSQGFSEYILYNGLSLFTPTESKVDAVYNNKLPMVSNLFLSTPFTEHAMANDATSIYGYEPLFNQKTFIIDRNFVVPSDIASKWDAQSHLQQGLIDRDTGEELLSTLETGLVQNEFVHPVYGSNNFMQSNGEYLKDLKLHPYSGGLRGGHCIGLGFIDQKQEWLNPNLYPYFKDWVGRVSPSLVLTSAESIKHYKIYFRTAFTMIRNYDPNNQTKVTENDLFPGGDAGVSLAVPNRTGLFTLQTQARNIGNASRVSTGLQKDPAPVIPALQKFLIDGTRMSWIESPQQVEYKNSDGDIVTKQYDPNVNPNSTIISELMARENIPNNSKAAEQQPRSHAHPPGVPAAQSGSRSNFPEFAFAYPFRYVENNTNFEFDRALVSQFSGSSNVTLAFQSDISSFTFQFFYEPFTSPFKDGAGGDLATRIFYGNRKSGIYNHDCLGGIVTWNWARPNYPRGVFSVDDIETHADKVVYPNGIDPFKSVAVIGKRFLNKLGFQDKDLDIVNNQIDTTNAVNTGFLHRQYTKDVKQESIPNGPVLEDVKYNSLAITFKGTNFSLIDSSDAILSAIDAPENSASLNKNNTIIPSSRHRTSFMKQLNGDYIFYPYSLNGSTDSFQNDTGAVRYDNCTDAYGSVGGMRLSNVARGMGTPNTQGSTSICDQTSIPVTLNVDCNLYLSYSAATPNSNLIAASTLPKKINHGHLVVLSSLIEEPNFIMAKAGAINGISLISKAFLTGDFILSNGMLSWYAKKTRIISSITTSIVNTNFESPTVLGNNSTVIYSITNNQPKPMDRPTTIYEIQQTDYQTMQMMQKHLQSVGNSSVQSPLTQLEGMLDQLGIGVIEHGDTGKSANLVSELKNQINAFGLNKLSIAQRNEFFKTPAGAAFMQNAGAMRNIMNNMKDINETQQNIDDGLGDQELIAQHNRNIKTTMESLRREGTAARARMADTPYVIPPDPLEAPELEPQETIPDQQVSSAELLKGLPHAGRRPPEGDARRFTGDKQSALKEKRRQAMEYKLEEEEKEQDRIAQQTIEPRPQPQEVRVTWTSGDMSATVKGPGATKDGN